MDDRDCKFLKEFISTLIVVIIMFFLLPPSIILNLPALLVWLLWYLLKRHMRK